MDLRYHLHKILKMDPAPAPWPRMIICAFATVVPLIIGFYQNHLSLAVFGSFMGFLLVLNDHLGEFRHRLTVLSLTFLIMLSGLLLGVFSFEHKTFLVPILLVISYCLGLMGGQGAELERAILFAVFQFLAAAYTPAVTMYSTEAVLYSLIGYLCVIGGLCIVTIIRRHTPNVYFRMRPVLKAAMASEKQRHFYALAFSIAVLTTLMIVEYFKIDHGYWAVGTVLLILRPDSAESVYRAIQRFGGTALGVLLAIPVITYVHSFPTTLLLLAISAIVSPWALARSYGVGSSVVVFMILVLLNVPSLDKIADLHISFLRLQATGLGCGLALLGVLLLQARPTLRMLLKKPSSLRRK